MPEIAQAVVEQPIAPNTPVANTSEDDTPKSKKLSYSAANIPNPVNNFETFQHAQLIEQRLTRMALEKIAATLGDLVDAVHTQSTPAKK